MITTIMKNISKTDTKLIWKKISHFTPILTYTPNKLPSDHCSLLGTFSKVDPLDVKVEETVSKRCYFIWTCWSFSLQALTDYEL